MVTLESFRVPRRPSGILEGIFWPNLWRALALLIHVDHTKLSAAPGDWGLRLLAAFPVPQTHLYKMGLVLIIPLHL